MKRYIFIALSLLMFTSCVDLLQEPQSALTDQTLPVTEQTLESSVNGLYKSWWGENYGFNCRLASLLLAGDDMISGDAAKTRLVLDDQMRVPADNLDVAPLWKHFYATIFNANNIISLIKTNTSVSADESNKYLGEARFMRALMYFYIARLWGDAPATTDNNAAGDIDGDETMPRKSVKDIYERIIVPDLKEAALLLPAVSRDEAGQAPTKWAALTMLGDVYMHMAGWPLHQTDKYAEAEKVLKQVIDEGPHSLVKEYKNLWLRSGCYNKTEHIFALHHSLSYLPSQYAISYLGYEENGWSDYAADPVFFQNFPNDTRKEFCFITKTIDKTTKKEIVWQNFGPKAPYIRKYRNFGGCGTYGIEGDNTKNSSLSEGITPIYRYADVLLLYAEASVKATGKVSTLAYDCINQVRDRAFGDTNHRLSGLSAPEFEKAVFDEYGWENCFEFKRWFQLVRTEMVDEMVGKNTAVDTRLNVNKQNYLFPVPVRQCQLRGWTNNPGY
ncbi:MAG: RagB/SusD family nutrient uptake outer membrane protein [Tidjanibacter sp.]|nr:RagB/SusD family nutrient uptake outer membrane protein [Tidjanibacter sp.]